MAKKCDYCGKRTRSDRAQIREGYPGETVTCCVTCAKDRGGLPHNVYVDYLSARLKARVAQLEGSPSAAQETGDTGPTVNELVRNHLIAHARAMEVTDQALKAERRQVEVLVALMRKAREHGFDHRIRAAPVKQDKD